MTTEVVGLGTYMVRPMWRTLILKGGPSRKRVRTGMSVRAIMLARRRIALAIKIGTVTNEKALIDKANEC